MHVHLCCVTGCYLFDFSYIHVYACTCTLYMYTCTCKQCVCVCVCRVLQTDILDINDIFRDLGTMVHDQGELVGKALSSIVQSCMHRKGKKHECQ